MNNAIKLIRLQFWKNTGIVIAISLIVIGAIVGVTILFWPLIILAVIFLFGVYPLIKYYFDIAVVFQRLLKISVLDMEKGLEFIQTEIRFAEGIVNAERSEMNVHIRNVINEANAGRMSNMGRARYKKVLALYLSVEVEMISTLEDKRLSAKTIDFNL